MNQSEEFIEDETPTDEGNQKSQLKIHSELIDPNNENPDSEKSEIIKSSILDESLSNQRAEGVQEQLQKSDQIEREIEQFLELIKDFDLAKITIAGRGLEQIVDAMNYLVTDRDTVNKSSEKEVKVMNKAFKNLETKFVHLIKKLGDLKSEKDSQNLFIIEMDEQIEMGDKKKIEEPELSLKEKLEILKFLIEKGIDNKGKFSIPLMDTKILRLYKETLRKIIDGDKLKILTRVQKLINENVLNRQIAFKNKFSKTIESKEKLKNELIDMRIQVHGFEFYEYEQFMKLGEDNKKQPNNVGEEAKTQNYKDVPYGELNQNKNSSKQNKLIENQQQIMEIEELFRLFQDVDEYLKPQNQLNQVESLKVQKKSPNYEVEQIEKLFKEFEILSDSTFLKFIFNIVIQLPNNQKDRENRLFNFSGQLMSQKKKTKEHQEIEELLTLFKKVLNLFALWLLLSSEQIEKMNYNGLLREIIGNISNSQKLWNNQLIDKLKEQQRGFENTIEEYIQRQAKNKKHATNVVLSDFCQKYLLIFQSMQLQHIRDQNLIYCNLDQFEINELLNLQKILFLVNFEESEIDQDKSILTQKNSETKMQIQNQEKTFSKVFIQIIEQIGLLQSFLQQEENKNMNGQNQDHAKRTMLNSLKNMPYNLQTPNLLLAQEVCQQEDEKMQSYYMFFVTMNERLACQFVVYFKKLSAIYNLDHLAILSDEMSAYLKQLLQQPENEQPVVERQLQIPINKILIFQRNLKQNYKIEQQQGQQLIDNQIIIGKSHFVLFTLDYIIKTLQNFSENQILLFDEKYRKQFAMIVQQKNPNYKKPKTPF